MSRLLPAVLLVALIAVGCSRGPPPAADPTRAGLEGMWAKAISGREGRPDSDLELHLNPDGTGTLSEYPRRVDRTAEMRADLAWRAEDRAGRPVLVIHKCALIAQGAETAIPYELVPGALRLVPDPVEGAGLLPDLAGDWMRVGLAGREK